MRMRTTCSAIQLRDAVWPRLRVIAREKSSKVSSNSGQSARFRNAPRTIQLRSGCLISALARPGRESAHLLLHVISYPEQRDPEKYDSTPPENQKNPQYH